MISNPRLLNSVNFRQKVRRIQNFLKMRKKFGNSKLKIFNFRAVKFGKKCGENAGKNAVTRLDVAAQFQSYYSWSMIMLTFYSCKYRLFFAFSVSPLAPLWNPFFHNLWVSSIWCQDSNTWAVFCYRIFLKIRYFGQKNSHRIKFE